MTIEERAAVIYEELTTYKHTDPVAWLAAALRQFEWDIQREGALAARAIAASLEKVKNKIDLSEDKDRIVSTLYYKGRTYQLGLVITDQIEQHLNAHRSALRETLRELGRLE